jgi:cytosine/creatinine deaminase
VSGPFDLLLRDGLLPDGRRTDIGCRDGRIAALGALGDAPAAASHELGGRLVTPGLVDAHVHLDKAFLSARAPSLEGTLAEAIRVTGEAKRRFTVEDIRARARQVLDLAVRSGTTAMRGHVEVDPIVGLKGLEAVLPLKAEYAPALDLQLCAFAQEGILQAPGTEALLARALRAGAADLVGGCPYNDTDPRAHVDTVFRLAREFDVDADFHADFFDEPEHLHVRYICEQTVRHGWQGRVAVGHLTELAALPPPEADAVIQELKAAGVGVILLPATDLYLMGRGDTHNVRRGLAPAKRLLAAGVPVAAATNNVRNAFTPVGNADLALMSFLLTVGAHMGTREEQAQALAMVTTEPARILRLADHGIGEGRRADLLVWEAQGLDEAVGGLAPRRLVVKGGRVSVEHRHAVEEPWRRR